MRLYNLNDIDRISSDFEYEFDTDSKISYIEALDAVEWWVNAAIKFK